jgi:hypothetical protein
MEPKQNEIIQRCTRCVIADAVIKCQQSEMCFDCCLDSLTPLNPGWGIALELIAEGYDYPEDENG